jgi:hypothetical protein
MELTRQEQLTQVLKKLQTGTPGIEGAAILSADGLVIASAIPSRAEEDRVSAMSAALTSAGSRTARELERGTFEQIHVKCTSGSVLLFRTGANAVLAVTASNAAKLGLIFLDIRRASQELSALM